MAITGLITSVALLLYFWAVFNVQRARRIYKVIPPSTTAGPAFNRIFRTQQTLSEHLIIFIPSLWMFSFFLDVFWGAVLGGLWVIGRLVYAIGYYQSADKRLPGNLIALPAELALVVGALIGATIYLGQHGIAG